MAGKKRTKKQKKALKQWLLALFLGALLLTALALGLKGCAPEAPPPSPDPIPGIDVSSHQGVIDWPAVAESGVEFAIIRLGYRSYRDGTLHIDEQAVYNLTEARSAGLRIGAYFFSQALNAREAAEEAALALEVLDGMELDLPLAYDWEYVAESARTGAMEKDTLTACVKTFCGAAEAAGYEPMVYFNLELSKTLLDVEEAARYGFWFAQYAEAPELTAPIRFWQYSDEGEIPGITEKVDLNWYYPE